VAASITQQAEHQRTLMWVHVHHSSMGRLKTVSTRGSSSIKQLQELTAVAPWPLCNAVHAKKLKKVHKIVEAADAEHEHSLECAASHRTLGRTCHLAPTTCPSRLPVKTAVRHTPLMQQGHFKKDPKPSTLPSKEAHAD
jgi:hypothetical protein